MARQKTLASIKKQLLSNKVDKRFQAVEELFRYQADRQETLPLLLESYLNADVKEFKKQLLELMAKIDANSEQTIVALDKALSGEEKQLVDKAMQLLRYEPIIRTEVADLIKRNIFNIKEFFEDDLAFIINKVMGMDERQLLVKELIKEYKADSEEGKRSELSLFRLIGENASAAIPAIVKEIYKPIDKFNDIESGMNSEIASMLFYLHDSEKYDLKWTLYEIGPPATKDAPALLEALTDSRGNFHLFDHDIDYHLWYDGDQFIWAHFGMAIALLNNKETRKIVYTRFKNYMGHRNQHVRRFIAELLGYYREEAVDAIPLLCHALLEDKYYRVRYYAADSLCKIGESSRAARKAIPALKQALGDIDTTVREHVQSALDVIDR